MVDGLCREVPAMARRPAAPPPEPDPDLPPLSVEAAVRETVEGLDQVTPAHVALVATALTLARKLDEGAGLATAAVARELRAVLDVLTKQEEGEDDELTDFVSRLSSPMGNPAFS